MANRTGRKRARRRPSRRAAGNGRLGMVGWIATAGVAGAWALSDGRPVAYVRSAVPAIEERAAMPKAADRVASLIESDRKPKPGPARPASAFQATSSTEEQTGSIRPTTRPVPPKPVVETSSVVPKPAPAPMLPFEKPALEFALRQTPRALAGAPATAPAAGAERHATRALVAHAEPDGASPRIAEIGSGSSVTVLRSAGDWRFVHVGRSGVEGWIDGRFLAGESGPVAAAPELATISQRDLLRR